MFAKLYTTGRSWYPSSQSSHSINCIVNGVTAPFTMTNDEIHCFGLYNSDHQLLGYFGNDGLTTSLREAVYTDGFLEPNVKDAPAGSYIKSVSKYYHTPRGYSKERVLH